MCKRLDGLFFLFCDSFDNIFFVALKNIFDLWEVSFDNVCHSAEILKQCGNFLLQGSPKDTCDFRLHRSNDTLDFFLIRGILSYEGALEFHNSLNDELKLVDFGLHLILKDVVVFEDLTD